MNGQPEQPRIGVFICHCGGNISDVFDVQQVANEIGEIPDVVNADTLLFACADPGQVRIEKVIADYKLNRVIVAACSPSLHEITFRRALLRAGMNPYGASLAEGTMRYPEANEEAEEQVCSTLPDFGAQVQGAD